MNLVLCSRKSWLLIFRSCQHLHSWFPLFHSFPNLKHLFVLFHWTWGVPWLKSCLTYEIWSPKRVLCNTAQNKRKTSIPKKWCVGSSLLNVRTELGLKCQVHSEALLEQATSFLSCLWQEFMWRSPREPPVCVIQMILVFAKFYLITGVFPLCCRKSAP